MLRVQRCARAGLLLRAQQHQQRRTFIKNPFASGSKEAPASVPADADKVPQLSAAEKQRLEEEEIMRLINEETLDESVSFFESVDSFYTVALDWLNPCNYARAGIAWVHGTLGVEWWAAIAIVSVGVRLVMIPLQLFVMRNNLRQGKYSAELRQIDERERRATENERLSEKERMLLQSSFKDQREAIYKEGGFRPWYSFLGMAQAVPYGVIFYTTRSIMESLPSGGGALWFPNISHADPTMVLPLLAYAGLLVSSELNAAQTPGSGATGRWLGRVFATGFVYMFYDAPAGIIVGFVIAGWMQALPGLMLRSGRIREILRMPKATIGPRSNIEVEATGLQALKQRYRRWLAGDSMEEATSLGGGLGQTRHAVGKNMRSVSSFKVRK